MPILNTKLQIEKLVYKILVEVYLLSNLSSRKVRVNQDKNRMRRWNQNNLIFFPFHFV